MNDEALKNYLAQLEDLKAVATESARRMIKDDLLFKNHANLFVKSYLITLCTILESYLKAEIKDFVEEMNDLLGQLQLCKNPIIWGLSPKSDDWYKKFRAKQADEKMVLLIGDEDIDGILSANIGRTIGTFHRCGMDIIGCHEFCQGRDIVGSIVDKRNAIVHNNDDASDVTCNDIIMWIDEVKRYISGICVFVSNRREHTAKHIQSLNAAMIGNSP